MAMAIRCALLLLFTQLSSAAFAPSSNHVRMFATNLFSESDVSTSTKSFDEIAYETDRLSKDAKAMDVS